MHGERFLCERKGYLSFRGILLKKYDFLATKHRDTLGDWLKGGPRHIVVAERQMNIKEGACGIALTSLEDPACNKEGRVKGKRKWVGETEGEVLWRMGSELIKSLWCDNGSHVYYIVDM